VIRFVWLQFRSQAAIAFGALAILAIVLAITGSHLVHVYDTMISTCRAQRNCGTVTATFLHNNRTFRTWLGYLVIVAPGIIGVFWGAPLVAREFESGTQRLVLTQSVTRTRWLVAKISVIGLASILFAGLLSLMVTRWASPLDRVSMNSFATFDQRDIVPIGYAAFAFALGLGAGVLIRHVVPAMAATFATFVVVRIAFINLVRSRFVTALTVSRSYSASFGPGRGIVYSYPMPFTSSPGSWVTSSKTLNAAGNAVTNIACKLKTGFRVGPGGQSLSQTAIKAKLRADEAVFQKCIEEYRQVFTYQPASRYWPFQWYETSSFIALALVLCVATIWWVRRRAS
jgi:ABC-type transport system involved in multi-copper enzyme maturation permease subunit